MYSPSTLTMAPPAEVNIEEVSNSLAVVQSARFVASSTAPGYFELILVNTYTGERAKLSLAPGEPETYRARLAAQKPTP